MMRTLKKLSISWPFLDRLGHGYWTQIKKAKLALIDFSIKAKNQQCNHILTNLKNINQQKIQY